MVPAVVTGIWKMTVSIIFCLIALSLNTTFLTIRGDVLTQDPEEIGSSKVLNSMRLSTSVVFENPIWSF